MRSECALDAVIDAVGFLVKDKILRLKDLMALPDVSKIFDYCELLAAFLVLMVVFAKFSSCTHTVRCFLPCL